MPVKCLDLQEALQSDRSKIKINLIIYKVALKSQLNTLASQEINSSGYF